MDPRPSPSAHLVEGADAVAAALGRFDLHDAELRAVRLELAPGHVPVLEADFHVRADDGADREAPAIGEPATGEPGAEYRVTLRCTDIADLGLADFEHRNVVGRWSVEPLGPDAPDDGRVLRLSVIGVAGCDLELRCTSVAVVDVAPVPRARPV